MTYELRVARDGWSVEQGLEKGREPPDWWHEAVDRSAEAEWFLDAFWALSSCRSYGMGYGPIPWSAIWTYAEAKEMDDDLARTFEVVIRKMDSAYLGWHTAQQEARKSADEMRRLSRGK